MVNTDSWPRERGVETAHGPQTRRGSTGRNRVADCPKEQERSSPIISDGQEEGVIHHHMEWGGPLWRSRTCDTDGSHGSSHRALLVDLEVRFVEDRGHPTGGDADTGKVRGWLEDRGHAECTEGSIE